MGLLDEEFSPAVDQRPNLGSSRGITMGLQAEDSGLGSCEQLDGCGLEKISQSSALHAQL